VAYEVLVTPRVIHRVSLLPEWYQEQIERRLARLADDPRPAGARVIPGLRQSYRLRLMEVTLYYRVFPRQQLVLVNRLSTRQP
jgi:mRNA-degrading endonuclease RelE of RelBE toxin-antitoxin system